MNGYQKFFKEAGKASGLLKDQPGSPGKSVRTKSSNFRLKSDEPSPEMLMRERLAAQMNKKKKMSIARKRQKFPIFPTICIAVAVLSCTLGYMRPELMDQVFGHIELGAFGQAFAADDATNKSSGAKSGANASSNGGANSSDAEKNSEAGRGTSANTAPADGLAHELGASDIRNWSDEELSFFKKLNERKKELDLREAELNKVEEELQKQKVELEERLKQLEATRADISKTLQTRVASDQEKVNKLVEFYSNMKPQQAAKIIETVNEDLAIEVLDKMKKKNAAEIMDSMDAKKARRLSELLTGYQRTPASEKND